MPAHRCDGSELRTCCGQSSNEVQEHLRLPLRGSDREISCKLSDVSVHDRQFQRRVGSSVPLDQAAIVILGRGKSNPTNQPDMHNKSPGITVPHARSYEGCGARENFRKKRSINVAAAAYQCGAFSSISFPFPQEPSQWSSARSLRKVVRVRVVDTHCFGDF